MRLGYRNLALLTAAAVLLLAPLSALASGGGLVQATGSGPVASTTLVTLIIPGIVGIDIESDVTFDMSTLPFAASSNVCQNVFPPGASCTTAIYTPTAITTTAGATPAPEFTGPTTVAGVGAIYLSLLDTNSGSVATKHVTNVVPASWSGADPGIATTDLQTQKAGANNGGLGNNTYAALPTSATDMANGASIPNTPFNWTREDQDFRLRVDASTESFSSGTSTVTVTYSFSRT